MSRDYITRDELEQQLEQFGEALLRSFLKIVAPGGTNDPAFIAARQRAAEMEEHDPTFAGQVAAVRKARERGAFVTEGADVGRRTGVGVRKLSGPTEPQEDNVAPASALAAVRRKLQRGRE